MKLIEINWHPTDRQLWQFGSICLIALPAVGWIWGAGTTIVMLLATVGMVLFVAAMAVPKILKPVFLAVTLVATPIGMVIGELAMLSIYFGVFLPLAIAFRVVKRDGLQLRLDRNGKSYWEAKKQPANISSYYRQS